MKRAMAIGVLCAYLAAPALADLSFYGITNNNASDVAIGETQLTVAVTSYSATQALFTFQNTGPAASSITDIYFDDGTLLGIANIINYGDGVSFSQYATPPDLPGDEGIDFHVTAGFLADSNPPAQPNGVNPGESVGILFDLIPGRTFNDLLTALTFPTSGDQLRIGLRVQGFASGGSESFINNPSIVPLPGAVLLGMLGLGAAGMKLRRGV